MDETDPLISKIRELQEWERMAWRRVSDPLVTEFERREIRNHIKDSNQELRRCLAVMSERLRVRSRAIDDSVTT